MSLVLSLAVKSLLVAGVTLALLGLMRGASAAQRSFLAHAGLGALLIMPITALLLPTLAIETRLLGSEAAVADVPAAAAVVVPAHVPARVAERIAAPPFAPASLDIDWGLLAYLLPAALLAAVTLVAVVRLFALRAKARVIVEPQWLSALAHAQHRMNFKSGAALLVSDALPSPISWGLARPVILLSEEAVTRTGEAEAIIAHELAHVASSDWAKLILGRLVTALYWFNPLVWLLVRDAHQLREEAADDAVLAANVAGADYAALLVHTARHDCKAAMLAAHGVAPGKSSLGRRVHRVLDRSLPRTRMEARWAVTGALVALLGVAPLAALTLTPKKAETPVAAARPVTPLPRVAVSTDVAQLAPRDRAALADGGVDAVAIDGPPDNPHVTVNGKELAAYTRDAVGNAMRGAPIVDEDYRREIVRAYPPFASAPDQALFSLRAVDGDGDTLRELWRAGYRDLSVGQAVGAIAAGVDADAIADLAAAGCRNIPIGTLTGMVAAGVDGDMVRESGGRCSPSIIGDRARRQAMQALRAVPPTPPVPPIPNR
ncbi:M56 family metallopeptidase [Sphingomonas sp. ASV193]|uniref:M56 family metallopeptidase n=1 Tax=Sphingomonas sp. ASV193 TaxID=3144405 RepID=UPI0032E8A1DA